MINGQVFQFKALPFGLATAPLVFTKMLAPMAAYLHSLGIILHRYIDDILIRASSRALCLAHTETTIRVLIRMGFRIQIPKCLLDPAQDFVYVGIRFLTLLGLMKPPPDRFVSIVRVGQLLLAQSSTPARLWLSFIGLIGSAEKQVPMGRLYVRPIQACLQRQFSIATMPLTTMITSDAGSRQGVRWWMEPANVFRGQPLGPFVPDVLLFTDASLESWGGGMPRTS